MKKEINFAFIVHSRDRSDLPRKFPWLRYLPNKLFDFLTLKLPPFVVSKITGLTTSAGKGVTGIVVGIPMTAVQLLEQRTVAVRKIISAVKLAQSKGAIYVGLGAMTASLSRGGKDVIDNISGVYVTTGRTYTVMNIVRYVEYCLRRFDLNIKTVCVGIVGAAGGIGSGVAIALAHIGIKHFVLIDIERKLTHLEKYISIIERHSKDLTIDVIHKVSSIAQCQIVISATSSPEVVIKSEDVNSGTIIINDAQPSDISPEIIHKRNDVLLIEGGVLKSNTISCNFNFGLAGTNDIFSCLAETLWLSYWGIKKHHSVDEFSLDLYSQMKADSDKMGFYISELQNSNGYIGENFLQEFAKIIKNQTQ